MCCCRPFHSRCTCAVFRCTSSWDGFPYDSAVTSGRRSLEALCEAATSVLVDGASGPSNGSAWAHRHLLREDKDSV